MDIGFSKKDLKTGMICEQRYGGKLLVLKDTAIGDVLKDIEDNRISDGCFLSNWGEDLLTLQNHYYKDFDIVRVYGSTKDHNKQFSMGTERQDLIWERLERNKIKNEK